MKTENFFHLSKKMALPFIILSLTAGLTDSAFAEKMDAFKKGYAISELSDQSDKGFASSTVQATMILHNAAGDEAKRKLEIDTLEKPNDDVGDKSIVIFDSPADIEGTTLLSHAKILEPDDQWLLLNATNRIKRISSRNKSGPFLGSEFAFEDFTSLEPKKYTHEWIKEVNYEGMKCDVIKRKPKYKYSGYSYLLVWIDQSVHQVRKIEFYDRKGDLMKTATLENYKNFDGYWRSLLWHMVNHQTHKSTDFVFDDYKFHVGLTNKDFVKERLKSIVNQRLAKIGG